MTDPIDWTDRALAAWLEDGPDRGRDEGLEAVLAATRGVSQRPAWTFPARWLPIDLQADDRSRPRGLAVGVVLAALILLAIATVLIVGSPRRLPAPFGVAANGVIAYDTGRGGGIYLADTDGSNARRLAGADGIERSPIFSPDGTKLAFWSRPPDGALSSPDPCGCTRFHLYVADADGSDVHRLAQGATFETDPARAPSWSPDSTHVVVAAWDVGNLEQLWVVSADGASPAEGITAGNADHASPAWSPDGRWIAFAELTPGLPAVHAVAVVHPDGTGEQRLHRQPALPPSADEGAFADTIVWSPDSTKIAYGRGMNPGHDQEPLYWAFLEIVDLQGVERLVAPEESGWLHFPAWSPDGRSLAYVTGEQLNTIWVVGHDSGAPTPVGTCPTPIQGELHWSPDGRWLTAGCPGAPQLLSAAGGAVEPPIPLPSGASAIDVQRIAP